MTYKEIQKNEVVNAYIKNGQKNGCGIIAVTV